MMILVLGVYHYSPFSMNLVEFADIIYNCPYRKGAKLNLYFAMGSYR